MHENQLRIRRKRLGLGHKFLVKAQTTCWLTFLNMDETKKDVLCKNACFEHIYF